MKHQLRGFRRSAGWRAGVAGDDFDDVETADELQLMIERLALVEIPLLPRAGFLAPVPVRQLDFDSLVRSPGTRFELQGIAHGFRVEAQNPARALGFLAACLDQFQCWRRRLVAKSNLGIARALVEHGYLHYKRRRI